MLDADTRRHNAEMVRDMAARLCRARNKGDTKTEAAVMYEAADADFLDRVLHEATHPTRH